jgi:hypothetical protein
VFENRVLRRIFGPKGAEMSGGWRRLHNEELHKLCTSPDNIRVRKMIRPRNVTCKGELRNAYFFSEKLEGRRPLRGVDGRIILERISEK